MADEELKDSVFAQPEYLYTVLNLPTSASKEEIRERYRQLSLVFHPDKQHGKPTQDTALKRFLEIQKAYEILSDSATRQAYDLYGLEGIRLAQGLQLSGSSPEQIASQLAKQKAETDYQRTQTLIQSVGNVGIGVDAQSVFFDVEDDEFNNQPLASRVRQRLGGIKLTGVSVKNTIQKSLSDKLALIVSSQSRVGPVGKIASFTGRQVQGTLRYQYSPRIGLEASTSLFRGRNLTLGGNFDDGDNTIGIKIYFAPGLVNAFGHLATTQGNRLLTGPPPISLTLSRRLFPGHNTFGTFEFATTTALPTFTLAVASQRPLDLAVEAETVRSEGAAPPSRLGLAICVGHWSIGGVVLGVIPALFAECGLVFVELGIRLKARIESGLTGTSGVLSAAWNIEGNTALSKLGVDVGAGNGGVFLKLDMTYMNQTVDVPIILTTEHNPTLTFWTTVLPTTMVALGYHFVLRPRKRRQRAEFFRQAQRELREAKSDIVRAAEETVSLLRDTARRHMAAEASKDGLVIEEARYGPAGHGEEQARQLDIDVTVPLQALVHNSQLYIPGGRSKVSSRPALFLYYPSIATRIVIPVAEATLVGSIHGARDVPCRAQLKRSLHINGPSDSKHRAVECIKHAAPSRERFAGSEAPLAHRYGPSGLARNQN